MALAEELNPTVEFAAGTMAGVCSFTWDTIATLSLLLTVAPLTMRRHV